MKIYPSNYHIRLKSRVEHTDLPLGEIQKNRKVLGLQVLPQLDFTYENRRLVPNHIFDRINPLVFNEREEPIDISHELVREGDQYRFMPHGVREFSPTQFTFSALIQKNLSYRTTSTYNLRVAVIEDENWIKEHLISYYKTEAPYYQIPQNIQLNDGDPTIGSYVNQSLSRADFIFIETTDGIHYTTGNPIDFELFDEYNTTVVLVLTDNHGTANHTTAKLKNQRIFHRDYKTNGIRGIEDAPFLDEEHKELFDVDGLAYYRSLQQSAIIAFHRTFIEDMHPKALLEILMDDVLHGIYQTQTFATWCTDQTIDFYLDQPERYGRTHPLIQGEELFEQSGLLIDQYEIIKVKIDSQEVNATIFGNQILFRKTVQTDPSKGAAEYSYYTPQRTIIIYPKNQYHLLEKPIIAQGKIGERGPYLEILPGYSSKYQFRLTETIDFPFPESDDGAYLVYRGGGFLTTTNPIEDDLPLYRIHFKELLEQSLQDLRIRGGGLHPEEPENFNLWDIGHLFGRPYRIGGSLVIELPKEYEEQKEVIEALLERYKVATEKIYVIFTDQRRGDRE